MLGLTATTVIQVALLATAGGEYQEAYNKLSNDALKKTDGCAETGAPDKNDWITTCAEQVEVYPLIMQTLELLETLI